MWRTCVLLVVLLVASWSLSAQQLQLTLIDGDFGETPQRPPSEKSVALAAALSFFVWPGVGSYYAGNSGHGTRHVLISVVSAGAAIALLATCENDGFCDFDHDTARLSAAAALGAAYVANWAWSVIAAIGDAEDHNYRIGAARVSLNPGVAALTTPGPFHQITRTGLRLAQVTF